MFESLFLKEDYDKWQNKLIAVNTALKIFFNNNRGDFQLTIKPFKKSKSWEQIKAIHRLCDLLAIRLQESNGVPYDLETAKLWVKVNFGFTRKATNQECILRL